MTLANQESPIFRGLSGLPLWEHFRKSATAEQQATVRHLIQYASPLLDRVVETFPTYTLHNHVHSDNVVELMGKLLGPRMEDLSTLEAGMLILSAYFHDLGMAFDQSDPEYLREEPDFNEFLKTHPAAYVSVAQSATIPLDVAESYCRWRHAERVFHYLNSLDGLEWGVAPIKDQLGDLCRSHNLDNAFLKDHDALPTNFLGDCDLCFCAILLRLADILDFDNSRSPESVYKLLGMERRATKREKDSDVEWRKHLACEPFRFPDGERTPNYPLVLIAAPTNPGVEHDVRQFLDTIETELAKCAQMLRYCSKRWQNFLLPGSIDRSNIISKGYKYGEYRFTLDHDRILDLFMGDRLYDDPYVFVRELLQNAIDATRHRVYREQCSGNEHFEPDPIVVSEWRDDEGRQWVRVDDYGMGMSEKLVMDFMLKVGKSYYSSPEFQAELLSYKYGKDRPFTPISRFGIGLLSCFIVCDRIEITTLRVPTAEEKPAPVRLSLPGLYKFFTLQTGRHLPVPMPHERNYEKGYRQSYGTSIAVRIDSTKDRGDLKLAERLHRLLLAPLVPVQFEGSLVGGNPSLLVDKPWRKREILEFNNAQMKRVARVLDWQFNKPIKFHILPLDITAHSHTPELKGQFLVVIPRSDELKIACQRKNGFFYVDLRAKDATVYFRVGIRSGPYSLTEKSIALKLVSLSDKIPEHTASSIHGISGSWLSHNGIAVPTKGNQKDVGFSLEILPATSFKVGILSLSDSLRPDMSVARDEVRALPWSLRFGANAAVGNALREFQELGIRWPDIQIFDEPVGFETGTTIKEILDASAVDLNAWRDKRVIISNGGLTSIEEIVALVETGTDVWLENIPQRDSWHWFPYNLSFTKIVAALLSQYFLHVVNEGGKLHVISKQTRMQSKGIEFFPPMFFLPYKTASILSERNAPLNINHSFSKWLLNVAPELNRTMPGILGSIRRDISGARNRLAVKTVNQTLETLRKHVDPGFAPPADLRLSDADFLPQ